MNVILLLFMACEPEPEDTSSAHNDTQEPIEDVETVPSAQGCADCHPQHVTEWKGSAMHAASSPTFASFEMLMNRAANGAFAHGSGTPLENFCSGCHIPAAVIQKELPTIAEYGAIYNPLEQASHDAQDGISCGICHSTISIDHSKTIAESGVGTANAMVHDFQGPMQGPYASQTAHHGGQESDLLTSSLFCGTCHDVRTPKPDVVTGEPFLRVEDTFSEWKNSPWATSDNPYGKEIRCQDCHMSMFPLSEPGTRVQASSVAWPAELRDHANHAFTAVSMPLVDDERYPNVDTTQEDVNGFPLGQKQRRELLLQAAAQLDVELDTKKIESSDDTLRFWIHLENTSTGHNLPSGFSQEREVWVELIVSDEEGIIYEVGTLRDSAHPETGEMEPDGLLHDEDLQHRTVHVDFDTLQAEFLPGPHADLRPDVQLGMISLTNDFVFQEEDGSRRVVLLPNQANHTDNSRALAPFERRSWLYEVPMPQRAIVGPIEVQARLRFRAFPPKFLRLLAQETPDLVTEEMVDRNEIVDMTSDRAFIQNRLP